MLVPFITQRTTLVDNGIGDGIVIGRRSMTFQESLTNIPLMGMVNDDKDIAR